MQFRQFLETEYWGSMGAGILAYAQDSQKFLIALRSIHVNEPNTYGIIGGKIDDDFNNPGMEAKREFMEETGYNGVMRLIPLYVFKDEGFEYHNFLGVIPNAFTPKLNWETAKFLWLTYDELLKIEPKHFGLKALLLHSGSQIQKLIVS